MPHGRPFTVVRRRRRSWARGLPRVQRPHKLYSCRCLSGEVRRVLPDLSVSVDKAVKCVELAHENVTVSGPRMASDGAPAKERLGCACAHRHVVQWSEAVEASWSQPTIFSRMWEFNMTRHRWTLMVAAFSASIAWLQPARGTEHSAELRSVVSLDGTKKAYEVLLGPDSTTDQRRSTYARLLAAKTEFWRGRREVAGVLHFCGLGYSRPDGQTSDHFLDIERLTLEPNFATYVRDAFSPIGLMVDFWDDDSPANAECDVTIVVINASSSVTVGPDHFPAQDAVDGNMLTRWSSEFADPQWIAIDLGEVTQISRVQLVWEAACGKAYTIQVSDDGKDWQDVYATTSGSGGAENISFAPVSARWIRMHGTQRATPFGYSLWEFRVFR
jgi:hypothetical protein